MSTATSSYPNTIQFPHVSILRWGILLLVSLALLASVVVVAASYVTADPSGRQTADVIAIPVPVAPIAGAQGLPAEAATPTPSSTIVAVPVPTPPSQ